MAFMVVVDVDDMLASRIDRKNVGERDSSYEFATLISSCYAFSRCGVFCGVVRENGCRDSNRPPELSLVHCNPWHR